MERQKICRFGGGKIIRKMSDQEFAALDELYFIQTFDYLLFTTGMHETELKEALANMLEKGWIRLFQPDDSEADYNRKQFLENYRNYRYIASKAGLMAHNGREG